MGVGEAVIPDVVAEVLHQRALGREGREADGHLDKGPVGMGALSVGAVREEASTGWRLRTRIRSMAADGESAGLGATAREGRQRMLLPSV